jgi:hypothetical protein
LGYARPGEEQSGYNHGDGAEHGMQALP